MIIVNIEGGFGNQLFSYAFGYSQAKRNNKTLCIDTSLQDNGLTRAYELDSLKIQYDKRLSYRIGRDILSRAVLNKITKRVAIGGGTVHISEKTAYEYDPSVVSCINNKVYYTGNWQNYRYFSEYRDELIEMFQPKNADFSDGFKGYEKRMKTPNSVSIHIRRGDYVQIGCAVDESYYQSAIDKILKQESEPIFYVFTDDVDYAKAFMYTQKVNFKIVDYEKMNPTLEDFYLMSYCNKHIIANSSYSWWAAYLSAQDSVVIAPITTLWKSEFYPEHWIKLEV